MKQSTSAPKSQGIKILAQANTKDSGKKKYKNTIPTFGKCTIINTV